MQTVDEALDDDDSVELELVVVAAAAVVVAVELAVVEEDAAAVDVVEVPVFVFLPGIALWLLEEANFLVLVKQRERHKIKMVKSRRVLMDKKILTELYFRLNFLSFFFYLFI